MAASPEGMDSAQQTTVEHKSSVAVSESERVRLIRDLVAQTRVSLDKKEYQSAILLINIIDQQIQSLRRHFPASTELFQMQLKHDALQRLLADATGQTSGIVNPVRVTEPSPSSTRITPTPQSPDSQRSAQPTTVIRTTPVVPSTPRPTPDPTQSRAGVGAAAVVAPRSRETADPNLSTWNLLLNLVPKNRALSEDDSYWVRGIAEIRIHNATLADELIRLELPTLRPERRLAKLQERLGEEFFELQRRGLAGPIGEQKRLNDEHLESLIRPPNVRTMTLDEIVSELASYGFYTGQPRIPELQNAFEDRMSDVRESDQPKKSRLINFAGVTNAAVAATSGKNDFAANVNKVITPLVDKNVSITTLALGYFFQGSTDKFTVQDAKEGRAVVNLRIIDVWDYIKKRIADKEIHGGISKAVDVRGGRYVDVTGTGGGGRYIPQLRGESDVAYQSRLNKIQALDKTFSYNTLSEEVVDDFVRQLKLIFQDIEPKLLDSFILFCKTFGAKSAGYMPWLMRGATRGHGFKPKETETADESRYINPFALRLYQATRYDKLTFARYLSIFQLVDKQVFLDIVTQNQTAKREEGEEFYNLVEAFTKSKVGSTLPLWLTDTRQLFVGPEPKIDLNGCVFPLLPEVFTSTLGADAEREKLLADVSSGRISEQTFAQHAAAFVEKYKHQGYFPKYRRLVELTVPPDRKAYYWRSDWQPDWREALKLFRGKMQFFASGDTSDPSSNFDMNFYLLAQEAVEKMFDMFDKPLTMNMKAKDIVEQVIEWNKTIIGKAKLTPGPHQQLFAPLTCQLISQLIYCYESCGSVDKVNALYREILARLENPEGLPEFSRLEVIRLFGGDARKAPMYLVSARHEHETLTYNALRIKHYTKYDDTMGAQIKRAMPVAFGTKETPFEFEKDVSKETTKKDKV